MRANRAPAVNSLHLRQAGTDRNATQATEGRALLGLHSPFAEATAASARAQDSSPEGQLVRVAACSLVQFRPGPQAFICLLGFTHGTALIRIFCLCKPPTVEWPPGPGPVRCVRHAIIYTVIAHSSTAERRTPGAPFPYLFFPAVARRFSPGSSARAAVFVRVLQIDRRLDTSIGRSSAGRWPHSACRLEPPQDSFAAPRPEAVTSIRPAPLCPSVFPLSFGNSECRRTPYIMRTTALHPRSAFKFRL